MVGDVPAPATAEYVWTGAANDGRLATAGNWLGGAAPSAGGETVVFPVGAGTVVNNIASFAPASITFGSGIADGFTISGSDITVANAITNLSKTANAVFTAHVRVVSSDPFLQVAQSAAFTIYNEINNGVKGLVVFEGGLENEKAIGYNGSPNPYNLYAGHYVRTSDSDFTSTLDGNWREIITPASSLTVKSAGDTVYMYIGEGGAFTADVATAGSRLVVGNLGEYVVNGMLKHDSADEFNFGYCGTDGWASHNNGGKVKAKGIQIKGGGPAGLTGSGAYAFTNHWYIGELGMSTTPGDEAFFFTRNAADRVYIHPWKCDFAINGGSTKGVDIYPGAGSQQGGTIVFATDDEDGVGRTITVNGKVGCRNAIKDKCRVEIEGTGKVVLNSVSSIYCDTLVRSGATLVLNPNAQTGAGDVYIASGATLGFTNLASSVTVTNKYSFSSGAALEFVVKEKDVNSKTSFTATPKFAGTVYVKLLTDGGNPRCDEPYLLAEGVGDDESVFVLDGTPTWVDAVKPLELKGGKLYLNVRTPGLTLSVR